MHIHGQTNPGFQGLMLSFGDPRAPLPPCAQLTPQAVQGPESYVRVFLFHINEPEQKTTAWRHVPKEHPPSAHTLIPHRTSWYTASCSKLGSGTTARPVASSATSPNEPRRPKSHGEGAPGLSFNEFPALHCTASGQQARVPSQLAAGHSRNICSYRPHLAVTIAQGDQLNLTLKSKGMKLGSFGNAIATNLNVSPCPLPGPRTLWIHQELQAAAPSFSSLFASMLLIWFPSCSFLKFICGCCVLFCSSARLWLFVPIARPLGG